MGTDSDWETPDANAAGRENGSTPGSQRGGQGWRRGGMERETQGYVLGGIRAGRYAAE